MSRRGWFARARWGLGAMLVACGPGGLTAQDAPPALVNSAPSASPPTAATVVIAPAEASALPAPAEGQPAELSGTTTAPILPPDVQIVRFIGPPGVRVEVLGPAPEPVPIGDGQGLATVGLRVGVGYQLRVTNLPDRPEAVLYPYVELVGHLHRPPGIDPGKYPIRLPLTADDFDDIVTRGRMVTEIVYLEEPEQAIPLSLPKNEVPVVTLNPAENPLKVAAALGRVVAIIRLGNRTPTAEDLSGGALFPLGSGRCPFTCPGEGSPCPLPCGPPCGEPPPPGRPWMPKDEFLCDGGDFRTPAHFGGDGGLRGIDPRDAVVQFRDDRRARVLPTNMVCIYAPRFAAVRAAVGPNEALTVQSLVQAEQSQRQITHDARQGPKRFILNQPAEINRQRSRPSALLAKVGANNHIEVRVLNEADQLTNIAGYLLTQGPETRVNREKAILARNRLKLDGIKSAEGLIVTGLVEGAGQQTMAWKPQEMAGVEVPPNKPGLAVVKQVDTAEAEPGDVVTYTITYRNMGNVPITAVSILDSLLPRLEYVKGTAKGPKGTVFTAAENQVGSLELRWDIGTLPPGQVGAVRFQAKIR